MGKASGAMMDDDRRDAMIANGEMDQVLGEMVCTLLGERGWILIYEAGDTKSGLLSTMPREDTIEILRAQADALDGKREIRLRTHEMWLAKPS